MCSRTLPLFCTGETFFMLDAVNAGHSLKTSPVAEISRECYFTWRVFLSFCFFIPVLLPRAGYQRARTTQTNAFLALYKFLPPYVSFWRFFGQCSFRSSLSLQPSCLCAGLFLSDNWFSCLRDSHIVNEGTDLPCPCVMLLFPGDLPCCLVKLVYSKILAADTLYQLNYNWRKKLCRHFLNLITTKFDNILQYALLCAYGEECSI